MNQKVTLREMTEKDIPLKVKWAHDPVVNRYIEFDEVVTQESTLRWFKLKKSRNDFKIFIIETEHSVPIGYVTLTFSEVFRRGEFGIVIGDKNYHGKGYGTAAMTTFLDYCFNELHLQKVFLYVLAENVPAIKLYKKLGFIEEGYLKDDILFKRKYVDRILMSKFK